MKKLVLLLTLTLTGISVLAGCEDDPHDLDFLKDSGVHADGGAKDAGKTGTGTMDAGHDAGHDAGSDAATDGH